MVTSKYIQINDWCLVEYIYTSNVNDDGHRTYYNYYDVPCVKVKNNLTGEYSYISASFDGKEFDINSGINQYTKNCPQYSAFPVNQNKTLWAWGRIKNDIDPTDVDAIEDDIWHRYSLDPIKEGKEPELEFENTLQMKDLYFDTVRLHILSGYNMSDIDGICFEVLFRENSTKNSVACQYFYSSNGKTDQIIFNQSPIMMSQKSYDKYVEFKVPALSVIQEDYKKYTTLDSNYAYIYSHPARINDYKTTNIPGGYVKDSPIYFNLYEFVGNYSEKDIEFFYIRNKYTSSVACDDEYANLGCKLYESSTGDYFDYYATWENGFIEDYMNLLNKESNSRWLIFHTLDIYEQNSIGDFVLTSTFTNVQSDNFDSVNSFRPILKHSSATYAYKIAYKMQLINANTGEGVLRTSSFVGKNASKYGKKLVSINVTSGMQNINVYNKVINLKQIGLDDANGGIKKTSPLYLGNNSSLATLASTMEGVEYYSNGFNGPGYYATESSNANSLLEAIASITDDMTNVNTIGSYGAIDKYDIALNVSENITTDPGITYFGQAQLTIYMSKFDNVYKFKIYEAISNAEGNKEFVSYNVSDKNLSMRFILDNGSIKEYPIQISGENAGEIVCMIDKNASALLLNQKSDKNFYIILTTKNSNGTSVLHETVLYSGKYRDLSEKSEELYSSNASLIEWITKKLNEIANSKKKNEDEEEKLEEYQKMLNEKIKEYNASLSKLLSSANLHLNETDYNTFVKECPSVMPTINDETNNAIVNSGATDETTTEQETPDNDGGNNNGGDDPNDPNNKTPQTIVLTDNTKSSC